MLKKNLRRGWRIYAMVVPSGASFSKTTPGSAPVYDWLESDKAMESKGCPN